MTPTGVSAQSRPLPTSAGIGSAPAATDVGVPAASTPTVPATVAVVDAATGAQRTAIVDNQAGTLTDAATGAQLDLATTLIVDPASGTLIDPVTGASLGDPGTLVTPSSTTGVESQQLASDGSEFGSTGGSPAVITGGGAPSIDTSYVDSVIEQVRQEHALRAAGYMPYEPPPGSWNEGVTYPAPTIDGNEDPATYKVPDSDVAQLLRCLCGQPDPVDQLPPPSDEPPAACPPYEPPPDCAVERRPPRPDHGCDVEQGPPVKQSDDCRPDRKWYTVKCGDTLSSIAERFDVSWQQIYARNQGKIDNPDLIYPGQRLHIPRCDYPVPNHIDRPTPPAPPPVSPPPTGTHPPKPPRHDPPPPRNDHPKPPRPPKVDPAPPKYPPPPSDPPTPKYPPDPPPVYQAEPVQQVPVDQAPVQQGPVQQAPVK